MKDNDNTKPILNNEIIYDTPTRMRIRSYDSCINLKHFHRNIEFFGVYKGEVMATVADEKRVLHAGEIVVTNPFEAHGFEQMGDITVFVASIGSLYLSNFESIYKQSKLPRFLTDTEYNKTI
ncbi:MAG: cupin domain-containing protein, partial [Clostridiales bacterium]|nr:cupin domain-containing protein [Clostridiales bacterium]